MPKGDQQHVTLYVVVAFQYSRISGCWPKRCQSAPPATLCSPVQVGLSGAQRIGCAERAFRTMAACTGAWDLRARVCFILGPVHPLCSTLPNCSSDLDVVCCGVSLEMAVLLDGAMFSGPLPGFHRISRCTSLFYVDVRLSGIGIRKTSFLRRTRIRKAFRRGSGLWQKAQDGPPNPRLRMKLSRKSGKFLDCCEIEPQPVVSSGLLDPGACLDLMTQLAACHPCTAGSLSTWRRHIVTLGNLARSVHVYGRFPTASIPLTCRRRSLHAVCSHVAASRSHWSGRVSDGLAPDRPNPLCPGPFAPHMLRRVCNSRPLLISLSSGEATMVCRRLVWASIVQSLLSEGAGMVKIAVIRYTGRLRTAARRQLVGLLPSDRLAGSPQGNT